MLPTALSDVAQTCFNEKMTCFKIGNGQHRQEEQNYGLRNLKMQQSILLHSALVLPDKSDLV